MSKPGRGTLAEASPIATRTELGRRIANRCKPKSERHLTIKGWQQAEVHREVNALLESRIKALESRLDGAQQKLGRDFPAARLRGRARVDFDRSR